MSLIVVTDAGIDTPVSAVPSKVLEPIDVSPSANVTVAKLADERNASPEIVFTVDGIEMLVNAVHLENILIPIEDNEPKSTLESEVQPVNISEPIDEASPSNLTEVKLVQP